MHLPNPACADLLTAWLEALASYDDSENVSEMHGAYIADGVRRETRQTSYDLAQRSANYCKVLESKAIEAEFEESKKPRPPISAEYIEELLRTELVSIPQSFGDANTEPKTLRDRYFANFPEEKIKIRDVCWAVKQHYREWKRWLGGNLKSGSTADLAFRRILTSGKRPSEFDKKPRPSGWE
jgi:hypothetical protein